MPTINTTMKLWLLRPKSNATLWTPWYDKAFGFVVAAPDEAQARILAQAEGGDECHGVNWDDHVPAWTNPEYSTCQELTPGDTAQVIMRDFAAA